eukprot:356592-Chlamydomonas_euryale.AAC.5
MAIDRLPLADAVTIFYCSPAITALTAWLLLGERVSLLVRPHPTLHTGAASRVHASIGVLCVRRCEGERMRLKQSGDAHFVPLDRIDEGSGAEHSAQGFLECAPSIKASLTVRSHTQVPLRVSHPEVVSWTHHTRKWSHRHTTPGNGLLVLPVPFPSPNPATFKPHPPTPHGLMQGDGGIVSHVFPPGCHRCQRPLHPCRQGAGGIVCSVADL